MASPLFVKKVAYANYGPEVEYTIPPTPGASPPVSPKERAAMRAAGLEQPRFGPPSPPPAPPPSPPRAPKQPVTVQELQAKVEQQAKDLVHAMQTCDQNFRAMQAYVNRDNEWKMLCVGSFLQWQERTMEWHACAAKKHEDLSLELGRVRAAVEALQQDTTEPPTHSEIAEHMKKRMRETGEQTDYVLSSDVIKESKRVQGHALSHAKAEAVLLEVTKQHTKKLRLCQGGTQCSGVRGWVLT